jgi:hypothetical protein
MLGVGIGLFLSERIRRRHRREVATALVAIGAISTIPLAIGLFRKARRSRTEMPNVANVPQSGADSRSEGLMAD